VKKRRVSMVLNLDKNKENLVQSEYVPSICNFILQEAPKFKQILIESVSQKVVLELKEVSNLTRII